ncbi:MAG: hypothetical protein QM767_21880 [Anaeromyxobacter sp.]
MPAVVSSARDLGSSTGWYGIGGLWVQPGRLVVQLSAVDNGVGLVVKHRFRRQGRDWLLSGIEARLFRMGEDDGWEGTSCDLVTGEIVQTRKHGKRQRVTRSKLKPQARLPLTAYDFDGDGVSALASACELYRG